MRKEFSDFASLFCRCPSNINSYRYNTLYTFFILSGFCDYMSIQFFNQRHRLRIISP